MEKTVDNKRDEFNAMVANDPELLALFHAIDANHMDLDPGNTTKENLFYPDNLIPENLPIMQISPFLEEPDEMQVFTLEGNEVKTCNTDQVQEKSLLNKLSDALKKKRSHGEGHGR